MFTEKGSFDLFVTLANSFHQSPYTVLPFIFCPFLTDKKSSSKKVEAIHWRFIQARLDLLTKLLNDFGVDPMEKDPEAEEKADDHGPDVKKKPKKKKDHSHKKGLDIEVGFKRSLF